MSDQIFSYKRFLIKIFLFFVILMSIITVFVIWINMYINSFSYNKIYFEIEKLPSTYIWLILWASVMSNWELSDTLKDRVDSAILAYKAWKIKKFLVSWDNWTKAYDEVSAVKKYMIRVWIPKQDIFLDYAGFDTYDSMYRAKYIFQVQDMIVFTQNFHLPRSVYISTNLWISSVWFVSDRHNYVAIRYFETREFFANIKAFFDTQIFHSNPKFLWETIDIYTWSKQ